MAKHLFTQTNKKKKKKRAQAHIMPTHNTISTQPSIVLAGVRRFCLSSLATKATSCLCGANKRYYSASQNASVNLDGSELRNLYRLSETMFSRCSRRDPRGRFCWRETWVLYTSVSEQWFTFAFLSAGSLNCWQPRHLIKLYCCNNFKSLQWLLRGVKQGKGSCKTMKLLCETIFSIIFITSVQHPCGKTGTTAPSSWDLVNSVISRQFFCLDKFFDSSHEIPTTAKTWTLTPSSYDFNFRGFYRLVATIASD